MSKARPLESILDVVVANSEKANEALAKAVSEHRKIHAEAMMLTDEQIYKIASKLMRKAVSLDGCFGVRGSKLGRAYEEILKTEIGMALRENAE